jgi:hypothetical protein
MAMSEEQPDVQESLLLLRHSVFVRSARDAARQALFFLGMLYRPSRESFREDVAAYWETALHQVMSIVRGVYIPSLIRGLSKEQEKTGADGEETPDSPAGGKLVEAGRISDAWHKLRENLSWDRAREAYPLEKIPGLRDELTTFLQGSRAESKVLAFLKHDLTNMLRWLGRHLALIIAAGLVVWVSLGVEAVSGLLWNEGKWKLPLYIVLLPLPFYIHRWIDKRMRKGDTIYWLSVASRPFWSLRPLVSGPGRMIQRWPDNPPILGAIAKGQLIKLIVYMFVSLLSIFAIYFVRLGFEKEAIVTVPCILLLFYLMLLAANQLDFWDFIFYEPLRFLVLLLVGFVLFCLRIGFGRLAFIIVFVSMAAILWLLYRISKHWKRTLLISCVATTVLALTTTMGWFTHRARVWPNEQPPDILTRITLVDWPHKSTSPVVVMAASGGGSRAAVYAGRTLMRLTTVYPEIAEQLQAISSVSGGSLANAAYTVRLSREQSSGLSREQLLDDLVDALSSDFLLPTLLGAATPGKSRGESIETEWREGKVRLDKSSLGHLADRWNLPKNKSSDKPPFPIPLFNTATLEGHDLVISPLESAFFTNQQLHDEARTRGRNLYTANLADGEPTWVYYRHCVYGLENLLPKQDILLSSAVLASANFPFGFPVVKVEPAEELTAPLYFSPKPNPRTFPVKLTDGGALSNSGMWSLFNLLVNKQEELAERGVLLIVVEASKMPVHSSMKSTFNRILGTISDQAPIGRNLHELMFSYLEELYGDRFATVQLDLTSSKSKNIMTTWALDKQSRKTLKEIFNDRWQDEAESIAAKWYLLKQGQGCKEDYKQKLGKVLQKDFVARLQKEVESIGADWSLPEREEGRRQGDRPSLEKLKDDHVARLQEGVARFSASWCNLREENCRVVDSQFLEELQQDYLARLQEKVEQCYQQQQQESLDQPSLEKLQKEVASIGKELCSERWKTDCQVFELVDRRRLPLD